MIKVLFVCHGNICRSPMAEFMLKDLIKKAGMEGSFEIASAATSAEELGNPVYPPARRLLAGHGIDCSGKTARQLRREEYGRWDYIIGMDRENMANMRRLFGGDPGGKLYNMMAFAGQPEKAVADPWYTRDFERTWQDLRLGCAGLLERLTGAVLVDLSPCRRVGELYAVLREKLAWESWYGENLDALYDILTGLPHRDGPYLLLRPDASAPEEVRVKAERIRDVFLEAGKTLL